MSSNSANRLMILAGGTGGHVFPALAVANELRNRESQIAWLGTRKGLEATVVPQQNIEMFWVDVEGIRGKGIVSWLKAPFMLISAVLQSVKALRSFQPDCVLGMGGFVAGPGGIAARLLNKPLLVHEQNAAAGLTNKYLAKIARRVLTGFPNVIGLPASAEWVGNPVRKEISAVPESHDSDRAIRVLIIGGSQGAHSFNVYLPDLLKNVGVDFEVWHQSGRGRSEAVNELYQDAPFAVQVSEFIDDMAAAYQWADVLICRAGAMTIAECCAAAKPALLVPFPHSAGDHQRINGQMMVDAEAAWMVDNSELQNQATAQLIEKLLHDRLTLRQMGQAALSLHKADALQRVVSACEEYLHA